MNEHSELGRRKFLDLLMSVWTTGAVGNLFRGMIRGPTVCKELSGEGGRLAVRVMRFVNTAELWHHLATGEYAGWTDLLESKAVARIRESEFMERNGLGKSLLARISPLRDEVLPGWRLALRLTRGLRDGDGGAYLATLSTPRGEASTFTLASDGAGVIYGGGLGDATEAPAGLPGTISELPWVEFAPLGRLMGPRRGWLAKAAFIGAICDNYGCAPDCTSDNFAYCWECGEYSMCMYCWSGYGQACSTSGGGNCCNYGCTTNPLLSPINSKGALGCDLSVGGWFSRGVDAQG